MSKILIALYVAATSGALIVLKLGAKNGPPISFVDGRVSLNITLLSALGIVLYGISFLLYIYLISKFDLGYIIPLTTALVYIIIFMASFSIFHETFTALKIAGIFLIVAGLALLNIKQ
ncbi:hypothetical protein EYC59_00530 [Candidatus Saccharibacteria bacterium]|nr:MAG: hypothetical protein EYC59_00530 [Candidatus Saccharibacteria bacterium]